MTAGNFAETSFLSFMASTMQHHLIFFDGVAHLNERRLVGSGGCVEGADHGGLDGGEVVVAVSGFPGTVGGFGLEDVCRRGRRCCVRHHRYAGRHGLARFLEADTPSFFFDFDLGQLRGLEDADQFLNLD